MVDVIGQTFRGHTVDLDGKRFIGCKFFDCTLRFKGIEEFELDMEGGVDLYDVTLKCEGAATGAAEGIWMALWRRAKVVEQREAHG